MTIQKFTLLYAAALLAMVPARAQVPVENPTITILKIKPVQMPLAFQMRILPPPEYDHEYDGELTLLRVLEPVVYRACQNVVKPGGSPLGCAQRYPGNKCTIWIVTDKELNDRGWDYDLILRHEIGHCNGWHHN